MDKWLSRSENRRRMESVLLDQSVYLPWVKTEIEGHLVAEGEAIKTLGIRVKPHDITIAIYDCEEHRVVNVEVVKIPKALSVPEGLKYVRNTIVDVIREYQIDRAGLRVTESSAMRLNIRRLEIEGVIQEAFASSSLASYFTGQISSISSRISIPRAHFKLYVQGNLPFERVENWADFNQEEREAVLVALGAEIA